MLVELASWTGESADVLHDWRRMGLLPDENGRPLAQRIERVRLIRCAGERGYTVERLAEIAPAHGDMIGQFAEQLGALVGEPRGSFKEPARRAAVTAEVLTNDLAT